MGVCACTMVSSSTRYLSPPYSSGTTFASSWRFSCFTRAILVHTHLHFQLLHIWSLSCALFLLLCPCWVTLHLTLCPSCSPTDHTWAIGVFAFMFATRKHTRSTKKLKTWEDPWTEENGKWFYALLGSLGKQGYDAMAQWPYIIGASLMYVPGYRSFPHIFEKLCEDNGWDIDDVLWSFSEPYQNQVFGWSLGTGWIQARECVRQAYNEICGFDEKEMYFIQFEPISTFACGNYGLQYRCFDITKGPRNAQYHGKIPYKELTACQPMEFRLKPDQMLSGNSIKGTFLGTYY